MRKPINIAGHGSQSLNECADKGVVPESVNIDQPPGYCSDDGWPNQKRTVTSGQDLEWLLQVCDEKTETGYEANCDPMQTGQIVSDPEVKEGSEFKEATTLYRYSRGIRGCDAAVKEMFSNVLVLDDNGKPWPIPIMMAPMERVVAVILQENVRNDESLVVDRIKLPMLALQQTDIQPNPEKYIYHQALNYGRALRSDLKPGFTKKERYERDTVFGVARGIPVNIQYTLSAWTMYLEDMNQILEQVLTKFSLVAYIRVRGVHWEIPLKLDSVANNVDAEPGDQNLRVIKYQFNLTAETYIPQPIKRKKAVLKEKLDFFDGLNEEEITEVIDRIEIAVKELE